MIPVFILWALVLLVLLCIAFMLWRLFGNLTLGVKNNIEQATNIISELERIRVQMFLFSKGLPGAERGWEEFDKEIRLIVNDYIVPKRFTNPRT